MNTANWFIRNIRVVFFLSIICFAGLDWVVAVQYGPLEKNDTISDQGKKAASDVSSLDADKKGDVLPTMTSTSDVQTSELLPNPSPTLVKKTSSQQKKMGTITINNYTGKTITVSAQEYNDIRRVVASKDIKPPNQQIDPRDNKIEVPYGKYKIFALEGNKKILPKAKSAKESIFISDRDNKPVVAF
jgi:hypothetical protein